jgi:hypothetical protein
MKLASTVTLAERELVSATQTIGNILGGARLRMEQLAGAFKLCRNRPSPSTITESFRQQGIDPKVRFKWYAHGLVRGNSSRVFILGTDTPTSTTFGTIQNKSHATPNTGKPTMMNLDLTTLSWRLIRQH